MEYGIEIYGVFRAKEKPKTAFYIQNSIILFYILYTNSRVEMHKDQRLYNKICNIEVNINSITSIIREAEKKHIQH